MAQIFVSGVAHFFVVVGGSKIHERMAHFFIDIYNRSQTTEMWRRTIGFYSIQGLCLFAIRVFEDFPKGSLIYIELVVLRAFDQLSLRDTDGGNL